MSLREPGKGAQLLKRRKLSHSSDRMEVGESSSGEDEANGDGSDLDFSSSVSAGEEQQKQTTKHEKRHTRLNGSTARPSSHASHTGLSLPTGGMSKSSVMALQIDELLTEVRPNYDVQNSRVENALRRLKSVIEEIPPREPLSAVEAEKALRKTGVAVPFPPPRPNIDTKYLFEYKKPTGISLVGSVSLKFNLKGPKIADLAVAMPPSLFQEKDFLNYRAFHKRAYYLACISAGIKEAAKDEFNLSYEYQDDVLLLPALIVAPTEASPAGFLQSKSRIRIIVEFPDSAISAEKTLPTKNCVRIGVPNASDKPEATPFYNSCARSVASVSTYHKVINQAIEQCDAFVDSCRLGRIWLRQRGIGSSISAGGFGPFEWSAICALLLRAGGHKGQALFSNRYSPLQLFKAMLQFLAGRDLTDPMALAGGLLIPKTHNPMLYDGSTGVNVLFKMSPWSYQMVRHEASLALSAINASNKDNFDSIFIFRATEPLLKFDETFLLDISSLKQNNNQAAERDPLTDRIYKTLRQGFGDRVNLVNIKSTPTEEWDVAKPHPKNPAQTSRIEIGLILVSEYASRLVDYGPPAEEEQAAAEFREFWGEKAELRRFKDGSIKETLVWSDGTRVTLQITQYLAQHRLHLPPSSVTFCASNLESLVMVNEGGPTPQDAFKLVNSAYQTLSTQLHQLDGLPLSVRSISPADSQLCFSSLVPPLVPGCARSANTIIQFEGSARWPDALAAIQHTKIAFLLKLSEVLTSTHPDITTRVGIENSSSASSGHLNTSFLDVIYPSPKPQVSTMPVSFRIRIHHDREATLLSNLTSSKTLHGSVRDSLTQALQAHKRDFLATPTHTNAFANLSTRFPALSTSIRLLKKWASSHLLGPHLLPDELLDLLTAHVFLHPSPYSTPATPQTAFLRTLHLISRWDWTNEPLVVDLSPSGGELTSQEMDDIDTRFRAWRKIDPNMNTVILFAASNLDPTGVVWTQGARPPRVVASRLTALARAAVQAVQAKGGVQMHEPDWQTLFRSPLSDFDFLLHLTPGVVSRRRPKRPVHDSTGNNLKAGSEKPQFRNLAVHAELDMDRIGFDPVALFLDDLGTAFGHTALFFHDRDGGSVIAGLWNPACLGGKEWRVRLGWSSVPDPESVTKMTKPTIHDPTLSSSSVTINRAGILAEIARLGAGLVERVELVDGNKKEGE